MNGAFGRYAGWVALAGALGMVAAFLVGRTPEERQAALLGVALATGSGVAALWLKKGAAERSVNHALGTVGVVFAVRLVLVAAGLLYVMRTGRPEMAFVLGFFGEYFALQWIEISYVMAELKRRGPGGGNG